MPAEWAGNGTRRSLARNYGLGCHRIRGDADASDNHFCRTSGNHIYADWRECVRESGGGGGDRGAPGNGGAPWGTRPGTAQRAAAHPAAAPAVPGGAMKRVRFGGYTLEVPAGWPVYRLARDPGRCVRYDQHAVYLGQPGADQQCPAHLVGRTETISVQAGPGPAAGGPVYGGPVISGLPGSGGAVTGDPSGNLVHASLARAGLSITGTYGGSPREVLSIIRSVRPVTATRSAPTRPGPGRGTTPPPASARPTTPRPARHPRRPHRHARAWPGWSWPGQPRRSRRAGGRPSRPRRPAPAPPAPPARRSPPAPCTTGPGTAVPRTTGPGTAIPGTGGRGRTGPGATGPVASRRRARCTVSTAARPPRWP